MPVRDRPVARNVHTLVRPWRKRRREVLFPPPSLPPTYLFLFVHVHLHTFSHLLQEIPFRVFTGTMSEPPAENTGPLSEDSQPSLTTTNGVIRRTCRRAKGKLIDVGVSGIVELLANGDVVKLAFDHTWKPTMIAYRPPSATSGSANWPKAWNCFTLQTLCTVISALATCCLTRHWA